MLVTEHDKPVGSFMHLFSIVKRTLNLRTTETEEACICVRAVDATGGPMCSRLLTHVSALATRNLSAFHPGENLKRETLEHGGLLCC